jgi:DNA-binding IclR family transcriptional regulator
MERPTFEEIGGNRWSSATPSPAVLRAGAILGVLANAKGAPVAAGQIAGAVGVPRTSAVNVCAALCQAGLALETDRGFLLGPRLLELGQAYASSLDPIQTFTHWCRVHAHELKETVQLATLDRAEVVYLAKHDAKEPIQIASRIGHRLPANCTALGKAMLASLAADERAERLHAAAPLASLTRYSTVSVHGLLKELEEVAAKGYAIDDQEATEGILCVAAAIPGMPKELGIYGVSITTLKSLANESRINELAATVTQIAREIATAA